MEYMASQMDRQIDGAISENERLLAELQEWQASHADLLCALENLHALVEGECPSLLEDDHHDEMVCKAVAQAKKLTERVTPNG